MTDIWFVSSMNHHMRLEIAYRIQKDSISFQNDEVRIEKSKYLFE